MTPETKAAHERQKQAIMALASALVAGNPVVPWQYEQCEQFLNGMAALINRDPEICHRIEGGA